MNRTRRISLAAALVVALATALAPRPIAQARTPIDHYLGPGYPYELVSAKKADRIAWLVFERGMRNVYTASAPAFAPVRLTGHGEDDGIDLTSLRISDDGSTVVFVRGHDPNRDGWVANPTSNPDGAQRTIWAVRTTGGVAWKVAEGGSPELSPDGRAVLYVKDRQIYRAPVSQAARTTAIERGEKPFVMAWGSNGSPRWSPDGTRIAFVSSRGDHALIGIYDVQKRAVSYVSPSVDHDSSPTWSPDGKQLAFIRRPGTPFGLQAQSGTGSIGNPPGPAANAPGGRGGRGGRGGQAQGPQSSIPGLTRATFTGGYSLSFWVADIPAGLSRDDGSIEKPAREFWHEKAGSETFARVNAIQFTRDHVIFQAEPEEWIRYFSVPVAGGAADPVVLTPGDGMVEQIAVSSDGRFLYYATNAGDIDHRHIWKVPTAGGAAVQITTGSEIETYPAVLASGNQVAVLSAAAARPLSVAVVPAETSASTSLATGPSTPLGAGKSQVIFPKLAATFPAALHVVPQNVTLTADDGLKFNNQLFIPKNMRAGEKRPAVIFVHGGPARQMLLGYHYRHFYHMAYGVNQWLAGQGYVVMSVNYRSGIGYGRSFRTAPNTGGRGNAEYKDVLAAGKYLQTRADVDPGKIGIWGLSYGGVLTAQALARNSDIFKVGVDLAGVHLWGNSIEPDSVSFQASAVGAIGQWKSPVLLLHGDDDRNVAFAQTTGLVQLLRAHDVYHELIVFPDDVHDSLLYKRWIYTFDRTEEFLRRFLGSAPKITTAQ